MERTDNRLAAGFPPRAVFFFLRMFFSDSFFGEFFTDGFFGEGIEKHAAAWYNESAETRTRARRGEKR